MPILEVDGKTCVQTGAIARWLSLSVDNYNVIVIVKIARWSLSSHAVSLSFQAYPDTVGSNRGCTQGTTTGRPQRLMRSSTLLLISRWWSWWRSSSYWSPYWSWWCCQGWLHCHWYHGDSDLLGSWLLHITITIHYQLLANIISYHLTLSAKIIS